MRSSVVHPYPHRINGIPLLDSNGSIDDMYVDDIPDGLDPVQYISSLTYQSPAVVLKHDVHRIVLEPKETTISILHFDRNENGSGSDDDNSVINLI